MIEHVIAVASVYTITMALIIKTRNLHSAMLFKVVPFFLGAGLGIVALKNYGVI